MIDVTKLFVVIKRMTLSIGKVQIIKFKYLLNTINYSNITYFKLY